MRFKTLCLVGLATVVSSVASPATAAAAEVEYALDFSSAYVWRGVTFTDGAVFQPSVTASHDSGFSVNVWGNADLDDVNQMSGEFNEVDLTLSYGFGSETVSAEVGYIEYLFPNTPFAATSEVYLSLGFDVVASPSFTVYYDFDQVDGFYATFGVEFGNEINESLSWALSLTAGYAGDDFARAYGGVDGGLFDGNVSLSLSGDFWSAFVQYVDSLDDKALIEQPVDFLGGIGFSF